MRVGRLYQFNSIPSCRIVVEYVQQSGGLEAAARDLAIGVAGSAIYDALKRLLVRRSTPQSETKTPPMVEIHTTHSPGGISQQRLLVRTDDPEILKHAMDRLADGISASPSILEWSDEHGVWFDPRAESDGSPRSDLDSE